MAPHGAVHAVGAHDDVAARAGAVAEAHRNLRAGRARLLLQRLGRLEELDRDVGRQPRPQLLAVGADDGLGPVVLHADARLQLVLAVVDHLRRQRQRQEVVHLRQRRHVVGEGRHHLVEDAVDADGPALEPALGRRLEDLERHALLAERLREREPAEAGADNEDVWLGGGHGGWRG